MNRVFVDTSALYSLVRADDPDHERVEDCFKRHEARLVTSNFILDELLTLVKVRLGHRVAVRVGNNLRAGGDIEVVRILPEDEDSGWEFFEKQRDKDYSFTDCTSFALMRRMGIILAIATDHHYKQAGFSQEP